MNVSNRFIVGGLLMVLAWAGPASRPAAAGGAELVLDGQAVQELLESAAPFEFRIGIAALSETLICDRPRDLQLGNGTVRLRSTCRGRPIPLRVDLEPELTVVRNAETGHYEALLSKLPLVIPGFGQVDLRNFIPRLEIPAVIWRTVQLADRPRILEIRLREIRIEPGSMAVHADVRFVSESPESGRSSPSGG